MRDGLAFIEEYQIGQTSHVIDMLYGEGKDDMAAFTAALPLAREPGTCYNYSSGTSKHPESNRGRRRGLRRELSPRTSSVACSSRSDDERGRDLRPRAVSSSPRASCTPAPSISPSSDCSTFAVVSGRTSKLISREWGRHGTNAAERRSLERRLYSCSGGSAATQYGTYWANGYEGQMISVVPALDAVSGALRSHAGKNYDREWRGAAGLGVLAQ